MIDSDGIADATSKQIGQTVHFRLDLLQSRLGFRITLASSFSMGVLPVLIEINRFADGLTLPKLLAERAEDRRFDPWQVIGSGGRAGSAFGVMGAAHPDPFAFVHARRRKAAAAASAFQQAREKADVPLRLFWSALSFLKLERIGARKNRGIDDGQIGALALDPLRPWGLGAKYGVR